MKIACQYAIIRFLPFLETDEFANVGLILFAPKTGYWGFKIAPASFPRVTKFFGELDRKVYREAIKGFHKELEGIQTLARLRRGKELQEFSVEVTRLRESLLRFGELRTLVADDPQDALNDLYDRFVGRNFVNKEYREDSMTKAIKTQLADINLDKQYVQRTLVASLRTVTLPLVSERENNLRVIKPLSFNQQNASKLIEHAELWKNKIQWLLEHNVLTEDKVLLAVEPPGEASISSAADLTEAYHIAKKDLETLAVELVPFLNTQHILDFAQQDLGFDRLQ